ncbi:MAG: IPT/TIG domain-containing protein [Propionibacteriaceae bacterium]|nr:IPT/TIG domain-containing protein [Propionibacteriaceae bacterium]
MGTAEHFNEQELHQHRSGRQRTVLAAFLAICLVAPLALGLGAPADSEAAANTLYVNSDQYTVTGEICAPGNDIYDTTITNNLCTLRAALTYANAHSTAANPLTVTLATDFAATIPDGTTRRITTSVEGPWMATDFGAGMVGTSNAYYAITQPMVVDLENKLGYKLLPGPDVAGIYVDAVGTAASPILLKNLSELQVNEASIVVSGHSSYVTITGGHTQPMDNYFTANFLVIANGASHITLSNYTIGNLWSDDDGYCLSAMVCFVTGGLTGATASDILIDNVTFTVSATTGLCLADNSAGCVANAIVFDNENAVNPISIDGFEVRNSTFNNLWKVGDSPTVLSASPFVGLLLELSNFDFHDNQIINSGSSSTGAYVYHSSVYLPYHPGVPLGGTNYIRNNTFTVDSTHPVTTAIGYYGSVDSPLASASNLFIQDNAFDGFTQETILLDNTGLVTVQRNTFGPHSASQATTAAEESLNVDGGPLLLHNNMNANLKIDPWYPTQTTTAVNAGCTVDLAVAPPTGTVAPSTVPATPVRLDVYWNDAASPSKAEVFVASTAPTLTTAQTITVSVPAQAIDAAGNVTGSFRLQTQAVGTPAYPQLASSQFSRAVPVAGNCQQREVTGVSPAQGPVVGGGTLTVMGQGLTSGNATVHVFLAGLDATGTWVRAECPDLATPAPDTLTCTIPPSPLGGDRTGPAQVTVTWTDAQGTRTLPGQPTYLYTAAAPTLTTFAPAKGGVAGGPYDTCAATGSGLITLVDGASFTGTQWVDPGLTLTATSRVVVRFRSAGPDGTVVGGGAPGAAFGVSRVGTTWQTSYGAQTTRFGQADQAWHTAEVSGNGTKLDGLVVTAGATLGGPIPFVLGGVLVNDGLTAGFVGEIGQVAVFDTGTLTHHLVPAAWTVADQTVLGFLDEVTGHLWPGSGGTLAATLGGAPYVVAPTSLTLDGQPVTGVTVTSATALTCVTLPPHAPATTAAVVTVAGTGSAGLAGAHVYLPNGTLQVETLGWLCTGGETTYDEIVSGCTPVESGGVIPPGTIMWTYTTTYVRTGPESTGGLANVTVSDDEGPVCVIADLPLDTPVRCVKPEPVGAGRTTTAR